jgi:hypothetical protein
VDDDDGGADDIKVMESSVSDSDFEWIIPPPVAWVRKRSIPTERLLLEGEDSANFCG